MPPSTTNKDTLYSVEEVAKVSAPAPLKSPRKLTSFLLAQHSREGDLWIVIDTVVYDLSRFVDLHPGGGHVLLTEGIAGTDASEAFFSLHRSEVLEKYERLIIGRIRDATRQYILPIPGALSPVPHGEPGWLTPSFRTPYYGDSHRALQTEMRMFFDVEVKREAREHEVSHERPTKELVELMGTPR